MRYRDYRSVDPEHEGVALPIPDMRDLVWQSTDVAIEQQAREDRQDEALPEAERPDRTLVRAYVTQLFGNLTRTIDAVEEDSVKLQDSLLQHEVPKIRLDYLLSDITAQQDAIYKAEEAKTGHHVNAFTIKDPELLALHAVSLAVNVAYNETL